jgi:hypothetical protein
VRQIGPIRKAQRERERDSDRRHRKRCCPHPEHLPEIRLQSDLEEQEHDSELGEHMYDLGTGSVYRNDSENTAPEKDAGDQLPENSRLSKSLCELAQELGGNEHDRQDQEQIRNGQIVHGEKLERFLGSRPQDEGVLEEWQVDLIGVLRLYSDPPVLIVSSDLEVRLGRGALKE